MLKEGPDEFEVAHEGNQSDGGVIQICGCGLVEEMENLICWGLRREGS